MEITDAGYAYLDDQTAKTTTELTGLAVADITAMAAAVLAIIAGILGLAAKSKGVLVLGVAAAVVGAAGVVLAIMKDASTMVLAGAALTAVTALILSIFAAKNKAPAVSETAAK